MTDVTVDGVEEKEFDTEVDAVVDTGTEVEEEPKVEETEYVAPTKEEFTKTQEALKKANGEAKKNRLLVKELKEQIAKGGTAVVNNGDDVWKPRFVKSAARAELATAGVTTGIDRLLKTLDFDSVEVDDDGIVSGLDTQIDQLREDFPQLFETKRTYTKRMNIDAADNGNGNSNPKSATELQAAKLFGK